MDGARILNKALLDRVVTAEEAAALIPAGVTVGMSGFTGAGYPKAVPLALAKRIMDANLRGEKFRISIWTGASTAPELDGALAMVDGIELRLPYQSDPVCRKKINAGEMEYIDIHLSHVGAFVRSGFLGKLDLAVVEVTGILPNGDLIPSSSVGNNKVWLDYADKVILEVNSSQSERLEGMHDIYEGFALPPNRKPIPLSTRPTGSGRHTSGVRRRRSSPSSRPTRPTGTRRSPFRTTRRGGSRATSSNSSRTR
jgi:succinyl-CoA:acetate CoA-transferase